MYSSGLYIIYLTLQASPKYQILLEPVTFHSLIQEHKKHNVFVWILDIILMSLG